MDFALVKALEFVDLLVWFLVGHLPSQLISPLQEINHLLSALNRIPEFPVRLPVQLIGLDKDTPLISVEQQTIARDSLIGLELDQHSFF